MAENVQTVLPFETEHLFSADVKYVSMEFL